MDSLPADVIGELFDWLNLGDLARCARLSRVWNRRVQKLSALAAARRLQQCPSQLRQELAVKELVHSLTEVQWWALCERPDPLCYWFRSSWEREVQFRIKKAVQLALERAEIAHTSVSCWLDHDRTCVHFGYEQRTGWPYREDDYRVDFGANSGKSVLLYAKRYTVEIDAVQAKHVLADAHFRRVLIGVKAFLDHLRVPFLPDPTYSYARCYELCSSICAEQSTPAS